MIARSAAVIGVEALAVEVQVDARLGTFNFQVVGLPDGAIREARDRVISAIRAAGYFLPDRHITVNLAPSDLRKEGSGYDLPIAVGVLTASRLVPETDAINDFVIIGELSLDGGVRPVRGVLAVALAARAWGMKGVIVPEANAQEAAFVQGIDVIGVTDLPQIVQFLRGELDIAPTRVDPQSVLADNHDASELDYAQVVGQEHAKRAMEIAAAGGHNVLLAGPPGGGKTMLARRLTTILPPMSLDEALEVTKIHSIAGRLPDKAAVISRRPFESPHHTISDAGLAGGGAIPRPGTISLAHNGVLFLDELPEFSRHVLETLRQPLEEGDVTVVRAAADCTFPARFSMVAAMNPCPTTQQHQENTQNASERNAAFNKGYSRFLPRCPCTRLQRESEISHV
ncbi:YifB family Mg chelatase-like AAA ATPase [bacterium]|nr:YifB family Mg chelatase-like AAA ATPase [bacterium]